MPALHSLGDEGLNVEWFFHDFKSPPHLGGQLSEGLGFSTALGTRSLFSCTDMPFRSLKTPALTTRSPAFKPVSTLMKSPRDRPVRTNFWLTTASGFPPFLPGCDSIT